MKGFLYQTFSVMVLLIIMRITLQSEFFGQEIDVGYYILFAAVIYVIFLVLYYIRMRENGVTKILMSLMMTVAGYFSLVGLFYLLCYISPVAQWLEISCQSTSNKWTFPIGSAMIMSILATLEEAFNRKRLPRNAKVAFHKGISSKYDRVVLVKEEDLPKWVTLGSAGYCIRFEPEREHKAIISILSIHIRVDDEGEINFIDLAMEPSEWEQKENLEWPTEYQTGKVTLLDFPKKKDWSECKLYTNQDRSLLCIEMPRDIDDSSQMKERYRVNQHFLLEVDPLDRILRMWFQFTK